MANEDCYECGESLGRAYAQPVMCDACCGASNGFAAAARLYTAKIEALLADPSPEDAEMLGEAARRRWARHEEDGAPPATESLYASIVLAVLAELRARVEVPRGE